MNNGDRTVLAVMFFCVAILSFISSLVTGFNGFIKTSVVLVLSAIFMLVLAGKFFKEKKK